MPTNYEDAARNLAMDPNDPQGASNGSSWPRFNSDRSSDDASYRERLFAGAEKLGGFTVTTYRQATTQYRQLSLLQQILLALAAIFAVLVISLFFLFGEAVFAWIAPLAEEWRGMAYGWAILWAAVFVVSFPPLIGYSSCLTLSGFVYGMQGWLIVSTATVVGSTVAFLVSRHLLHRFVERRVQNDRRFSALALTLKHDGLKLLIMIRLCPLPYSLSNGAIATFQGVTPLNFAIATAAATPRLLIHVFIGSRLAAIANGLDEGMDSTARFVNWISIIVSIVFGAVTAWYIYSKTQRRAAELEAQNGELSVADDEEDELTHPDRFLDDGEDEAETKVASAIPAITLREARASMEAYKDEPTNGRTRVTVDGPDGQEYSLRNPVYKDDATDLGK